MSWGRKIVVDGETWKWAVKKEADWSEMTPCDTRTLTLQGPDGYRKEHDVPYAVGVAGVTPSFVAEFIRKLKAEVL